MFMVYILRTPENKVYIGSSKDGHNPNNRWRGGCGYNFHTPIGKAIVKFGWDNIEHTIVSNGLTAEDARELETKLINVCKATDPRYGYNKAKTSNTGTNNKKGKWVDQFTKDGQFIKRWSSQTEAAAALGLYRNYISDCCRGAKKTHGGFQWKYSQMQPTPKKVVF